MADIAMRLPTTQGPTDGLTVARQVIAHVDAMKRDGSWSDGTALCWSPAELEALARFAITANNDVVYLRDSLQPKRRSKTAGRASGDPA